MRIALIAVVLIIGRRLARFSRLWLIRSMQHFGLTESLISLLDRSLLWCAHFGHCRLSTFQSNVARNVMQAFDAAAYTYRFPNRKCVCQASHRVCGACFVILWLAEYAHGMK